MKITLIDWKTGHPFALTCASDVHYVKLANKINDHIRFASAGIDLDEFEQYRIAKQITCYFEDVISGFGIWQAFITKHRELYGKCLPFYEVDEAEYYPDEINLYDVCFLVWMSVQQERDTTFLNPENPMLMKLGEMAYNILDAEFENAPINHRLLEFIYDSKRFDDFFLFKRWCYEVYSSVYLFQHNLEVEHEEEMENGISDLLQSGENLITYTAQSILSLTSKVGPLALTTPEWLSLMFTVKGMNKEAALLANIKSLPYAIYSLKEYNDDVLIVESVKGDVYTIDRSSINNLSASALECNALITAFALYGDGNWQVNGTSSWLNGSDTFNELQHNDKLEEEMHGKYDKLLKTNGGYPLFYFADYDAMHLWLGEHLGFDPSFEVPADLKDKRAIALFIHPDGQLSILPNGALSIKDDRNPYYNEKVADQEAVNFLISPTMTSKEMVHFLLEHRLLPDARINSLQGPARGRQLIQDNIDFVVRFFRRYMY